MQRSAQAWTGCSGVGCSSLMKRSRSLHRWAELHARTLCTQLQRPGTALWDYLTTSTGCLCSFRRQGSCHKLWTSMHC